VGAYHSSSFRSPLLWMSELKMESTRGCIPVKGWLMQKPFMRYDTRACTKESVRGRVRLPCTRCSTACLSDVLRIFLRVRSRIRLLLRLQMLHEEAKLPAEIVVPLGQASAPPRFKLREKYEIESVGNTDMRARQIEPCLSNAGEFHVRRLRQQQSKAWYT
jgi:hypothetical protein